jgi:phosphonopyruvate decarboxylase
MTDRTSTGERGTCVDRRTFVARLLHGLRDALVVSGLGSPSYDVFAAGDRDRNFYLWGTMGGAAPLGLGLALARPRESVVVITGDGEMLMGLGSLATIGAKQPRNLGIVVLDNGCYGETGMQRSHTSLGTDLVGVARSCGIAQAFPVDALEQCDEAVQRIGARAGTTFVQVFVQPKDAPRALPPRDGAYLKNRFRAALGLAAF